MARILANGTTWAIDGDAGWSSGERQPVLVRNDAGAYDECGRWLNTPLLYGDELRGFVHVEQGADPNPKIRCVYNETPTSHHSMVYATSKDYGIHWEIHGQFLTGTDSPKANLVTGEGDCSVLDGLDGYYYAYCRRERDDNTIVARAPVMDPTPGQWKKYYQKGWQSPGLGGDADSLGFVGKHAALWRNKVLNLAYGGTLGVGLFVSTDKVTFERMGEPLLYIDPPYAWDRNKCSNACGDASWNRGACNDDCADLIFYTAFNNSEHGGTDLGDSAFLTHTYLPRGQDRSHRYLVFRRVRITETDKPVLPQVGVALARFYDEQNQDRWSTTGPALALNRNKYPGKYEYESTTGYLMTKEVASPETVKLEECYSETSQQPDYMVARDGFCATTQTYARIRTAGWVYKESQPNTVALYRCQDGPVDQFVSTDLNCEGKTPKELLGYALAQ